MLKVVTFWVLLVCGIVPGIGAASDGACPPDGYTLQQLQQIRKAGFELETAEQTNALAVALLGCVGDPDPEIRDGVVYEGLSSWMRGQRLSIEAIHALFSVLVDLLGSTDDPGGFQRPFAALILSEVARTDRLDNTLTPAMREVLVLRAADYLANVRDYRGFSATEGWRHAVAHGADLVLQLVLDPNIDAGQIERLMGALAEQVAPAGEVFYIYGEPDRLARAVYYAHARGLVSDPYWSEWFANISDPRPLENWAAAWTSQEGLARRHNTRAFLLALHFSATLAPDEQGAALANLVVQAMTRLSGG
jgi:hypothetical protein